MREMFLCELKAVDASRVILALGRDLLCGDGNELNKLRDNIIFFKSHGFEVCAWINAFGFGIPETPAMASIKERSTKIKSIGGYLTGDAYCPTDELFTKCFIDQVKEIAKFHPDIILLDDDMCLSVRPGIGCFCNNHLALLAEETGVRIKGADGKVFEPQHRTDKEISFSELPKLLFTGGSNKYRSAWFRVMGDTLRDFCIKIRKAIDQVDDKIRAGFCAGFTSFDFEGAAADELSLILAGKNTKPLLRLSGAPYWAVNHINRFGDQRLHAIIEFVRAQEFWCCSKGIELFHEGDVYPRPRTIVPASWLECYDGAIRASGNIHSFKYMFDYVSAPGYENGYIKFHKRNLSLYREIDKYFADKKTVGVRIYEAQYKTEDYIFPNKFIGDNLIMQTAFSPAAAFITENGIPATYDDSSIGGITFGVNVKEVIGLLGTKNAPKKLVLDISATLELQNSGIDMGIVSCVKQGIYQDIYELFGNLTEKEYGQGKRRISLHKSFIGDIFSLKLKDSAKVQSRFSAGSDIFPASFTWTYKGTEFLVYAFDGYTVSQSGGIFVSYERQKQLIEFFGGFPYVAGCPYLYSLIKKDEKETAVFFANINDDAIFDFDIVLDKNYSRFEIKSQDCQQIEGKMLNGKIHIDSTVSPYGMFVLVLRN